MGKRLLAIEKNCNSAVKYSRRTITALLSHFRQTGLPCDDKKTKTKKVLVGTN